LVAEEEEAVVAEVAGRSFAAAFVSGRVNKSVTVNKFWSRQGAKVPKKVLF